MKIGWKAGQIEDVEPVAARQMISDGRATDPRDEEEVEVQVDQTSAAPPATADKTEKPRKAKQRGPHAS